MRICYLTSSAIPSTSANSIATVKICEAFRELKNEVILITRNVKNNNKDIFHCLLAVLLGFVFAKFVLTGNHLIKNPTNIFKKSPEKKCGR